MNGAHHPEDALAGASREQILSSLFANMVVQLGHMAMVFLGQLPHPETGQKAVDIESAKLFIDQLEMLEAKTKGNLSQEELALLRQSLTAARMAFVEAIDAQPEAEDATTAPPR